MENKELKEVMMDLLGALLEIRKEINKKTEEDKEDPYAIEERRLIAELKKDLNGFFKWALNMGGNEGIKHNEIATTWRKLHPDLPVPRVSLIREDRDPAFLLFLMDAYPLYLKHKEEE